MSSFAELCAIEIYALLVSSLFHSLFHGDSDSDGGTHHRVVAHTEEAHHLDVCRDG